MNPTHPRKSARPLALAALTLLVLGGPALGAVRTGTSGADTLVGTTGKDAITGEAGDDTLKGLAGDDTYHFADGWGKDTLEEKRTYRARGKKQVPGGSDTLSFAAVDAGFGVGVSLVPEWRGLDPAFNRASMGDEAVVKLGASPVENVVGTALQADFLQGGGAANRLASGGGQSDDLWDLGGYDDGPRVLPDIDRSNDTYAGVAANTGRVNVVDWGGTDTLDLRPLRANDVVLNRIDHDGDGDKESLQIVTGTTAESQVIVYGQFGEFATFTASSGQNGRIETLRFNTGPISFAGTSRSAGAVDGEALLGRVETERQRQLAERAPALAEAARQHVRELPAPGAIPTDRRR